MASPTATSTTVTIRLDERTKQAASAVVEDLGLDLSSVTRAFYKQIIRENRIPLSLSRTGPVPNDETIEALREADRMFAAGAGRFTSAAELLTDLDS